MNSKGGYVRRLKSVGYFILIMFVGRPFSAVMVFFSAFPEALSSADTCRSVGVVFDVRTSHVNFRENEGGKFSPVLVAHSLVRFALLPTVGKEEK